MANEKKPLYQRIVLKLSGEALMGTSKFGIDPEIIEYISGELADIMGLGVQVGLVIGGGNFFRGKSLFKAGSKRVKRFDFAFVWSIFSRRTYTIIVGSFIRWCSSE